MIQISLEPSYGFELRIRDNGMADLEDVDVKSIFKHGSSKGSPFSVVDFFFFFLRCGVVSFFLVSFFEW